MAAHRTLFEILGVSPDATDKEVEQVFQQRLEAAILADAAVPQEFRLAYEVLHSAANRGIYADLLWSCQHKAHFPVAPGHAADFRWMCAAGGIRIFEVPDQHNVYAVRLPDQPLPDWALPKVGPATEPPPAPEGVWGYLTRQILLFQVFRGRTGAQKLLLVAGYVTAVTLLGFGAHSGAQAVLDSMTDHPAAQRRALLAELRSAYAAATQALSEFDAAVASLNQEFKQVTTVSLDDAANSPSTLPRNLNLALIRTPPAFEALAEILNSRPNAAERDRVNHSLATVEHRLTDGSFSADDREALRSARAWIDECLQSVRSRSNHLDNIRVALKIDRFENASSSAERSYP